MNPNFVYLSIYSSIKYLGKKKNKPKIFKSLNIIGLIWEKTKIFNFVYWSTF